MTTTITAEKIKGTLPYLLLEEEEFETIDEKLMEALLEDGSVIALNGKFVFKMQEINQVQMFKNYVKPHFMHLVESPEFLDPEVIYTMVVTYDGSGANIIRLEAVDKDGRFRHASSLIQEMERTTKKRKVESQVSTLETAFKDYSFTYRYIREENMPEEESTKLVAELLETGCVRIRGNNFIKVERLNGYDILSVLQELYGEDRITENTKLPHWLEQGFLYEKAIASQGSTYEHNFFFKDETRDYIKTGPLSLLIDIEKYNEDIKEEVTAQQISSMFNTFFK